MRYSYNRYERVDGSWETISDPTTKETLYLGDMELSEEGILWEVPDSSGSNYSGDSVSVANYNVLLKKFEHCLGKSVWTYHGGGKSYGIVYAPTLMKIQDKELMESILDDLDDYPVLDEEELDRVKSIAKDDAWKSWINWDVIIRIKEICEDHKDSSLKEWFDTSSRSDRKAWFEWIMEKQSKYYIHEQGNSVYVGIDSVLSSYEKVKKLWPEFLKYYKES